MTPQVYQTGPLKGLPMRGPLPRVIVCPPIGDGPAPSRRKIVEMLDALPSDLKQDPDHLAAMRRDAMANAWPYAGDPALNDQLAVPGIPADAAPPPVQTVQPRPFRSGTPIVVILIACTLLYFAVRMLGLPS